MLTRTEETQTILHHALECDSSDNIEVRCIGDNIEGGLDQLLRNDGGFDVIVSSPFERLPLNALAGDRGGD